MESVSALAQQRPVATSDAEELRLLQAIARCDRRSLESLYRAYHSRLQRFLRRMTHRDFLSDEVINEVFWIVWQKAGDFQGASRVSTWIIGIAYRCMLKSLRQQPLLDEGVLDELASGDDPQGEHERGEWLARGLAMLSPDQRTTIQLAYYFGHSLEEIAEITSCPVGTVKARMFHARVRLRHALPMLAGLDAGKVA